MVIAINKTKLTVRESGLNEPDAPAVEPVVQTAPTTGPVLSRLAPAPGPSYAVYAVLGLIAVLLMGGLVLIQTLEIAKYNEPPAAFPVPGAMPAVATAPATPAAESQ